MTPPFPPLQARRLTLCLTGLPPLPLDDGQRRAWGWSFLLRAAIAKPLRNALCAVDKVQIALHFTVQDRLLNPCPPLRSSCVGQHYHVDLLCSGATKDELAAGLALLFEQLQGDNPLHLLEAEPIPVPALPSLTLDNPAAIFPATEEGIEEEIALQFDTPLPFTRSDTSRTRITATELFDVVAQRIHQILGMALPKEWKPEAWTILCGYWKFVDIRYASRSQNRYQNATDRRKRLQHADPTLHNEHISGCLGRLYVRAPAAYMVWLRPWLHWLQHWHLHASDGIALWGKFRLHDPAPSYFYPQLDSVEALLDVAHNTYRDYDVAPSHSHFGVGFVTPPLSESKLAQRLAEEFSTARWQPQPTTRFAIPKANGEARWVERFELHDLVAQRRMANLLAPVLDSSFSPNSLGYRKGMSRQGATERVHTLIHEGYRWVVQADIESFFPHAAHAPILNALHRLIPLADVHIRTLVTRMMETPWVDMGESKPTARTQGLAQGAPLSPLLANLLLDGLDRAMEPLVRHAMVRYADDFVLLARTKNDAQNLLEIVKNTVEILGLKLSEEKTHITSVKDGFDFLGEHFDRQTFENTAIPSNTGQRKPLLITESFLQIGLNGGAIDIRRNREIIDTIPLRRISEMVVLGKNNLSTALMQRLAEHKIPLSIALNGGYQMAVLTPDSRQFHETTWMQSRRYYAMTDTERLSVAYALVSAKLKGYTALVRKRNPICADTLRVIAQAQNALNTCTTVQELRGYEGYAAKACFAWLQKQLKPEVQSSFIALRRERGAGDRLNSMLNFGYYLSYTRLNGLVRASGLNPYLGFLHDGLDDYETLVADLQELVRPFVDRLIIQLVNMGYIRPNSFEKTERGLYLTKEATRTMAMEFERMMGQKIINQRLGDMLVTQIRHIRAFLCQGQSLWLFHFGMDEYPTSSTVPESDLENDDEESDESTSSWSTLTNERTT